jgi:hypothetical protein
MDHDVTRNPRATSSIWDRSFLLGIVALFSAGTLLTLEHLLSPRRLDDEPPSAADPGGDADADADD